MKSKNAELGNVNWFQPCLWLGSCRYWELEDQAHQYGRECWDCGNNYFSSLELMNIQSIYLSPDDTKQGFMFCLGNRLGRVLLSHAWVPSAWLCKLDGSMLRPGDVVQLRLSLCPTCWILQPLSPLFKNGEYFHIYVAEDYSDLFMNMSTRPMPLVTLSVPFPKSSCFMSFLPPSPSLYHAPFLPTSFFFHLPIPFLITPLPHLPSILSLLLL